MDVRERRDSDVEALAGILGRVALYESVGWEKVGAVDIRFGSPCSDACVHDGAGIRSFVFVGPDKPAERGSRR